MLTPLSAGFLPFFPLFVLSLSHFHFFSNFSFPIFSSLIVFLLSLSFPLFVLSLSHFHFFSNFSFPIFSSLIVFLLSLSFFSFSPPFLFWITLIHRDQVGETSPHLPSCYFSTPCLFSYFPLFFFILFIASCNT